MDRFDHLASIAKRSDPIDALLVSCTGLSRQELSLPQCIDSAMDNERRIQLVGTDEIIAEVRIRGALGQFIPKALAGALDLLHAQLLARGTDVDHMALHRVHLLAQREQVRRQFEQVLDTLRILTGKNRGTTVLLVNILRPG